MDRKKKLKNLNHKKTEFELVVENAFDFLHKSLEEFDTAPKYSVIHFHAAIELIMKARLLWEHWALIVSRPETANLKSFRLGNFQSVSIKEATVRLESIAQDGLNKDEIECFSKLSDHRNKMVHFYHIGSTGNQDELDKIVIQQCLAWYHVSRILERWDEPFKNYEKKISKIDRAMHKHRAYLKAKYQAIKEDISDRKLKGISFGKCPSCGFKSFAEESITDLILCYDCLVCKAHEAGVKIKCPSCGHENKLIGDPYSNCSGCGHKFDECDVQKFLTKDLVPDKNNIGQASMAHCIECSGYETVVEIDEGWICSQCFATYNSDEVGYCDWCNSLSTGDLEESLFKGCAACDGQFESDCFKED